MQNCFFIKKIILKMYKPTININGWLQYLCGACFFTAFSPRLPTLDSRILREFKLLYVHGNNYVI